MKKLVCITFQISHKRDGSNICSANSFFDFQAILQHFLHFRLLVLLRVSFLDLFCKLTNSLLQITDNLAIFAMSDLSDSSISSSVEDGRIHDDDDGDGDDSAGEVNINKAP